MEQEDLDSHVADIRTFVDKILDKILDARANQQGCR